MRIGVVGIGAFVLAVLLAALGPGYAQSPASPASAAPLPSPGFVPPYEIMRTARAAGFDPLAPPLREGTTYVLRATDFRGMLMRVVVDARTGAIRDANRIVPGPGSYGTAGQLGMTAPYDGSPDVVPPPYGPPPEFDPPRTAPIAQQPPPALQPPAKHHAKRATAPLPRARPAELAAHKPGDDAKPITTSDGRRTLKSDADLASPAAAPAKPGKTPLPPIND